MTCKISAMQPAVQHMCKAVGLCTSSMLHFAPMTISGKSSIHQALQFSYMHLVANVLQTSIVSRHSAAAIPILLHGNPLCAGSLSFVLRDKISIKFSSQGTSPAGHTCSSHSLQGHVMKRCMQTDDFAPQSPKCSVRLCTAPRSFRSACSTACNRTCAAAGCSFRAVRAQHHTMTGPPHTVWLPYPAVPAGPVVNCFCPVLTLKCALLSQSRLQFALCFLVSRAPKSPL